MEYDHIPGRPPSLGDLIREHGNYGCIPEKAWAEHELAWQKYLKYHRSGEHWYRAQLEFNRRVVKHQDTVNQGERWEDLPEWLKAITPC